MPENMSRCYMGEECHRLNMRASLFYRTHTGGSEFNEFDYILSPAGPNLPEGCAKDLYNTPSNGETHALPRTSGRFTRFSKR